MLPPMRYKTFIWPHNPRTCQIDFVRQTAVQKVPMGAYVMQDLGRTCREMRGEGEFYGPGAYEQFKTLASVFYDAGPGVLFHPVWQTSSAYFTELQLKQEPREDYVAYRFVFREGFDGYTSLRRLTAAAKDSGKAAAAAAVYHTVAAGQTLWGIAGGYGLSLGDLLALNPSIANPNLITVGQKVRVT